MNIRSVSTTVPIHRRPQPTQALFGSDRPAKPAAPVVETLAAAEPADGLLLAPADAIANTPTASGAHPPLGLSQAAISAFYAARKLEKTFPTRDGDKRVHRALDLLTKEVRDGRFELKSAKSKGDPANGFKAEGGYLTFTDVELPIMGLIIKQTMDAKAKDDPAKAKYDISLICENNSDPKRSIPLFRLNYTGAWLPKLPKPGLLAGLLGGGKEASVLSSIKIAPDKAVLSSETPGIHAPIHTFVDTLLRSSAYKTGMGARQLINLPPIPGKDGKLPDPVKPAAATIDTKGGTGKTDLKAKPVAAKDPKKKA